MLSERLKQPNQTAGNAKSNTPAHERSVSSCSRSCRTTEVCLCCSHFAPRRFTHMEPQLIRVPTRRHPHTHTCFVLPQLQKPSGSRSRSCALPKSHSAANRKSTWCPCPRLSGGHKEGSSVQGEPSSRTTAAEGSRRFQGAT